MKTIISQWLKRYFSEPEAGILSVVIVGSLLLIILFHRMLAPVFVSIVIAYLLDWGVLRLQQLKVPHFLAVLVVFIIFITLVVLLFAGVIPPLTKQLNNLVAEMPNIVTRLQTVLTNLPKQFAFISTTQIENFLAGLQIRMAHWGQTALSYSFTLISNLVVVIVYLVMVPLLVYFFLMDKNQLIQWTSKHFIPQRRKVLTKIWDEVHIQIGNYVRGKVLEAIIVALVTYITFLLMGLPYALLLGALVGLSVFIPYIGAIVITIPVVIVALVQWGWSSQFLWLTVAYVIIIAVDANVLVPLLFSEAVSLHPVAIIVAILMFGGLGGFWGIFFAIPLAALVKSIMNNWPITKN